MAVIVVYDHLPQCAVVAVTAADALAMDIAKDAHKSARRGVPVRTGALFRGIEVSGAMGNGSAEVTSSSLAGGGHREYAFYVEFGTRNTPAQPYMVPAAVYAFARLPIHARTYGRKIEMAA